MRFAGWFAIVIGALMLAQWTLFLSTGNVPELGTEPYRIGFHLAGELATAVLLVLGGSAVQCARPWGRHALLVALGMLLYTAIVSAGYFAQRGEPGFVAMFGVIFVMAIVAVRLVARSSNTA